VQSVSSLIIGYTRSGKAIYDRHDHEKHGNYTYFDIEDAAYFHAEQKEKLEDELKMKKPQLGSSEYLLIKERIKYHYKQFGEFFNKAKNLQKAQKSRPAPKK
jgi:hypothetical protein